MNQGYQYVVFGYNHGIGRMISITISPEHTEKDLSVFFTNKIRSLGIDAEYLDGKTVVVLERERVLGEGSRTLRELRLNNVLVDLRFE